MPSTRFEEMILEAIIHRFSDLYAIKDGLKTFKLREYSDEAIGRGRRRRSTSSAGQWT